MRIQIQILNKFGQFDGEFIDVDDDQYEKVVTISKDFYKSGFELTTEDGSVIIFPPEIVKESILKISKSDV